MINAVFCDYQIKYIILLCRRFVKCGKSISEEDGAKKQMRIKILVILLNMCYNIIHFEIY